jgi:hypothetical protein
MSIYWHHLKLTKYGKFCEENQQSFWAPITSTITWKKVSFIRPLKSSILGPFCVLYGVYPTFVYRGFDAKVKQVIVALASCFLTAITPNTPLLKRPILTPENGQFRSGVNPTFETHRMRHLFDAKLWQKCSPWMIKTIVWICPKCKPKRWPLSKDYRQDGT